MTKIREIKDRAACAAWSPIQSKPDFVVLATKDSGAAGFEDTGGELEIYDFGFAQGNHHHHSHKHPNNATGDEPLAVKRVGSVKTTARFASVAWTSYTGKTKRDEHDGGLQPYPMGIIAGGMMDGVVHFWNPADILAGKEGRILSLTTTNGGALKALSFNSLEPFHLAVGGSNGDTWIVNLSEANPTLRHPAPGSSSLQKAEITALAWNSQVAHIVATAAGDGTVTVWDLKGARVWCELRAEAGQAVADLVWNPKQGLHLLTASADDRNPVIKVWDLAASTSMPVSQMVGHQGGILQLSWCPHDDALLLTTSKDTRTFLWDLTTFQAIAELPNEDGNQASSAAAAAASNNPSALFAQASSFGQKHMRYQVDWSPHKRGIALTCSLDRKVQAHSILSLATRSGRPPAWMKPSCGLAVTSFGGTLLTCPKDQRTVTLSTVVEEELLVKRSLRLERDSESLSIGDFCRLQQQQHLLAKDSPSAKAEATIWGFLQVLFESNARQALLAHLGYKIDEDFGLAAGGSGSDAGEKAVDDITNGVANMPSPSTTMSPQAKTAVKRALVVGNFEAAVDICFQNGNSADALLLASCGGADLWAKTQQRYFDESSKARPYLSIVRAVIRNQLEQLIEERNVAMWQETLAILSTYGASEEFPRLCISLGKRVDESGDAASASLCYMCALSLEDTVKFWKGQLESNSKGIKDANKAGMFDLLALHQFVIKVHVFLKAIASSDTSKDSLSEETANLFFRYAKALADQGAFVTAAKYCIGSSMEAKILRDRLYRGRSSQACLAAMGGTPPEFPYIMVNVGQSRGQVWAQQQREAMAYQKQQQEETRKQEEIRRQQQQQAYNQRQQDSGQQYGYAHPQQQALAPRLDALPPGWIALQDPSSGMTYYANQTTGESSWEKPLMPTALSPVPVSLMAPSPVPLTNLDGPMPNSSTHSSSASRKQTLASKYGDGFVSSASDPKLANQYGNVGTGNPYGSVDRPGTAAAAVLNSAPVEEPPISATPNLDDIPVPDDVAAIRDSFMSVMDALKAEPSLTPGDRRQLSEAEKGVVIVIKKLSRGALTDDLKARVSQLSLYLVNRDFATASQIQTTLVNSDWKTQKDWLKGIKLLIQLAHKKLPQPIQPGYY